MKKRTLIAATALTLTCLGGQAITAQAATNNNCFSLPNGSKVIIGVGSGCDMEGLENIGNLANLEIIGNCKDPGNIENIQDILGELGNCFPNGSIPDFELPGGNAFIKEVVNLVNAERAKEGLSPLSIDPKVQAAAMVRAQECEKQFSHTRPDGSSFTTALKEQNVSYRSAGENIAWGQRTPEEVMNAWMNSSGHRANIMNPDFTTIGVGYYGNAQGTDYWCQIFTR